MSYNPRLTTASVNAAMGDGTHNGLSAYISSSSKLAIYTGSQPSWSSSEVVPAGSLLATLTAAGTFSTATAGVLTATGSPHPYVSAAATGSGTTGCFVALLSDGTTPYMDGTSGQTSGYDLNFDDDVIVSGGTTVISSMTITLSPH